MIFISALSDDTASEDLPTPLARGSALFPNNGNLH